MSNDKDEERPERLVPPPLPPIPTVDSANADQASVDYSHYRTKLSRHRTELSEHRTDLSEYRTDLSGHRTELSEHRTELSNHRTNMSMRRTGMSLHRTRMSADRTLMSVMRTSLSLIGFGFTLYQVFEKFHEAGVIKSAVAPRNFGLSLILLGIVLLVGGIWRQIQFANELRSRRHELVEDELIYGQSAYPVSVTLISAVVLLIIGILAVLSIVFNVALFG